MIRTATAIVLLAVSLAVSLPLSFATATAAEDGGRIPAGKPWEPAWGFWPQYPQAWMQTHQGFVARTKQGGIDVVFFGDSITQGWGGAGKTVWEKTYAPLKAVNYGIGGDGTRQVLWRIQHGEVDGLTPKLVVLGIGTNNLYSDANAGSDEEIAKGTAAVVAALRAQLPAAKILLLGILPRQNEFFCGRIARINAITKGLDDGASVRFLDLGAHFLAAPGQVVKECFGPDQLHLVEHGYEVWAANMQPLFAELLR
jgi:lysophospholipase L1-like esterase